MYEAGKYMRYIFRAQSIRKKLLVKSHVIIRWLVLSEKCHTNMRRNIKLYVVTTSSSSAETVDSPVQCVHTQ